MDVKEIEDHKFDDLKLKLEKEIENLQKYIKPAELSIEELEKVEPLDEKKIQGFKDEIKLLESEIKERQDKIDLIDVEVKHRVDIRLLIENALKDLDFEEEEVHKKWDRESKEEVEFKVPLINRFLHDFEFCDHIEIKEENEEGIEVLKEIKHIPWDKESVLKDLKLKLDLDKANDLVRRVKDYKHNKKKGELENKLKDLVQNNVYFLEAFGEELVEIKGEIHVVHRNKRIAKWDKDDLILFEEKIVKLEAAKLKLDDIEKKEKPIKLRKQEYHKIDDLLFEALVEKHEEGRPEKMEEYLKLRKEIKDKNPLEE
jgi:hypothetical protein